MKAGRALRRPGRGRNELLGWPHMQVGSLYGTPQGRSCKQGRETETQQLDPTPGRGSEGFLDGQGPPWSDHQGSARVAGQRCWWERPGQVRRAVLTALAFILYLSCPLSFLTSSLCPSLRDRMEVFHSPALAWRVTLLLAVSVSLWGQAQSSSPNRLLESPSLFNGAKSLLPQRRWHSIATSDLF